MKQLNMKNYMNKSKRKHREKKNKETVYSNKY